MCQVRYTLLCWGLPFHKGMQKHTSTVHTTKHIWTHNTRHKRRKMLFWFLSTAFVYFDFLYEELPNTREPPIKIPSRNYPLYKCFKFMAKHLSHSGVIRCRIFIEQLCKGLFLLTLIQPPGIIINMSHSKLSSSPWSTITPWPLQINLPIWVLSTSLLTYIIVQIITLNNEQQKTSLTPRQGPNSLD